LQIKGFQGTSLLDYPGKISSLLFFGGCNLTCPFCHNPGLVLDPGQYPDYPLEHILQELKQRRPFIDAVVISGGEPTLVPGLDGLLRAIKELGLSVKLDTNGLLPQILEGLMRQDLVDFVAMDVKTNPGRYGELHTRPVDPAPLQESIRLLIDSPLEYEFRTTCVPGLVEEEDIEAMGRALAGAKRWVLQQYVPGHALAPAFHDLEPHAATTLQHFAQRARDFAAEVSLRGV
jgi:pyruvate formate lyase activating enzyme